MDAVRFIEERRRMYKVTGKHSPTLAGWIPAEEVVKEVEEWSDAHPRKTRQSVFLEQYPEAEIDANGLLTVCPAPIFHSHRLNGGGCRNVHKSCEVCRREFWMQEME